MVQIFKFLLSTLTLVVGLPLFLWVAGYVVYVGAISLMIAPSSPERLDAAIVLTGGSNRVEKGLDLLSDDKVGYLLVSGVHKDVTLDEIIGLRSKGATFPKDKITLGREAGNTIGNAIEARAWIGKNNIQSAYVITSNYHIPRAVLEFRHTLPDARLVPYPVEPKDFSPIKGLYWKTSFIEYHKLIVSLYRILVYPDETQPIPPSMTK